MSLQEKDIERFIVLNRKNTWDADFEKGQYCIAENKVREFLSQHLPGLITEGARVYIWDPYLKDNNAGKSGPAQWQGGQAYGNVVAIRGDRAWVKYDDTKEEVEESLSDLKLATV